VWSSLSPQSSTKDALSSFRSWGTSAATNFTKKYAASFLFSPVLRIRIH
jgi:hypothetical protein